MASDPERKCSQANSAFAISLDILAQGLSAENGERFPGWKPWSGYFTVIF
jgi:hypothetical protein